MDAKHWNGAPGECLSDEPWPSVDDDRECENCGADADEPCKAGCSCDYCRWELLRPLGDR